MTLFSQTAEPVRAVIIAAMHAANLDFYTDASYKQLFLNKEQVAPQYLNPVKLFIKGRFRFLFKYFSTGRHS